MGIKSQLNSRTEEAHRGDVVVRVPVYVTSAQWAGWLAELSEALDEAQRLVWRLTPIDGRNCDALDLAARIEAALAQVQSLRLARRNAGGHDSHPEWSNLLPWDRGVENPGV